MTAVPFWSPNACAASQQAVQVFSAPSTNTLYNNQVNAAQVTQQHLHTAQGVRTPFLITGTQSVPTYSPHNRHESMEHGYPLEMDGQRYKLRPPQQQQPVTIVPGFTRPPKQVSMVAQTAHFVYKQQNPQLFTIQHHETQKTFQQPANFVQHPANVVPPTYSAAEVLRSKLIEHEPCIHTLIYLEAKIETQKQLRNVQEEQLQTLCWQSARQKKEITQLKLDRKAKERRINLLKSQIASERNVEASQADVSRLKAVIKGQREELERIRLEGKRNELKGNLKVKLIRYVNFREEITHIQKGDEESGEHQREVNRLLEENTVFRLEIARLERENSEVAKLRVKIVNLTRRMGEMVRTPQLVPPSEPTSTARVVSQQEPTMRNMPSVSHAHLSFSRTK